MTPIYYQYKTNHSTWHPVGFWTMLKRMYVTHCHTLHKVSQSRNTPIKTPP